MNRSKFFSENEAWNYKESMLKTQEASTVESKAQALYGHILSAEFTTFCSPIQNDQKNIQISKYFKLKSDFYTLSEACYSLVKLALVQISEYMKQHQKTFDKVWTCLNSKQCFEHLRVWIQNNLHTIYINHLLEINQKQEIKKI